MDYNDLVLSVVSLYPDDSYVEPDTIQLLCDLTEQALDMRSSFRELYLGRHSDLVSFALGTLVGLGFLELQTTQTGDSLKYGYKATVDGETVFESVIDKDFAETVNEVVMKEVAKCGGYC